MKRCIIYEANKVLGSMFGWHTNNSDSRVYHSFMSSILVSLRRHGRARHGSLQTWGTIVKDRALNHVHIPDSILLYHPLDDTTVSVAKPSMADVKRLKFFSRAGRAYCSLTFLQSIVYIRFVPLLTATIFHFILIPQLPFVNCTVCPSWQKPAPETAL